MNIPRPGSSDESRVLYTLIGLSVQRRGSRKQPPVQTVPETDTGGLVEHTKALERTLLKELGKLPP